MTTKLIVNNVAIAPVCVPGIFLSCQLLYYCLYIYIVIYDFETKFRFKFVMMLRKDGLCYLQL